MNVNQPFYFHHWQVDGDPFTECINMDRTQVATPLGRLEEASYYPVLLPADSLGISYLILDRHYLVGSVLTLGSIL